MYEISLFKSMNFSICQKETKMLIPGVGMTFKQVIKNLEKLENIPVADMEEEIIDAFNGYCFRGDVEEVIGVIHQNTSLLTEVKGMTKKLAAKVEKAWKKLLK